MRLIHTMLFWAIVSSPVLEGEFTSHEYRMNKHYIDHFCHKAYHYSNHLLASFLPNFCRFGTFH